MRFESDGGSVIAGRRAGVYDLSMMLAQSMMPAVVYWKAGVGIAIILAVFGLFGWLLARSKRTHNRRFGGKSHWDL